MAEPKLVRFPGIAECEVCGRRIVWLEGYQPMSGSWLHDGVFSGDDALSVMSHLARPAGNACAYCGRADG